MAGKPNPEDVDLSSFPQSGSSMEKTRDVCSLCSPSHTAQGREVRPEFEMRRAGQAQTPSRCSPESQSSQRAVFSVWIGGLLEGEACQDDLHHENGGWQGVHRVMPVLEKEQ